MQGLAFLPQRTGKHTVGELSGEGGWHSLRLLMNLTGRTTLPSPALQGNLRADKVLSLLKKAVSQVCRWGTCCVQGKGCISKNSYVDLGIKTK